MKLISDISANVIKCDVADCPARFHSYSMHTIIRAQAKSEGWRRMSRTRIAKVHGLTNEQINGGRSVDVCPEHAPKRASK